MKNRKPEELESRPRLGYVIMGILAIVLIGLVLVSGRFYLANWRGDMVFLPVVLFLALFLVAGVIKWLTKNH